MDKRTVIAIILVGIIFLFFDDYLRWMYPPPPATDSDSTAVAAEDSQFDTAAEKKDERPYVAKEEDYRPDHAVKEEITIADLLEAEPHDEVFITVENELFRVRISSLGARLVSFKVKPNGRYLKEEVELLPMTDSHRLSFRFWTYDGPVETAEIPFDFRDDYELSEYKYYLSEGESQKIEFISRLDSLRSLSVIYTFRGDDYSFNCEVKGTGLESSWVRDYVEVHWSGGLAYTEESSSKGGFSGVGMSESYFSQAYIYFVGDELIELKVNNKKTEITDALDGETRWAAVRNKYFMTALIPETQNAISGWMESIYDSSYTSKDQPNRLGVGLRVPIKYGLPVTPIRVFIGPLDYKIVSSIDPTLDETMNWGWAIIEPISKGILWTLMWLRKFIPNYGLCIIIFSILVKVIIWPLTRKSYQSMSAMQRIQPKVKALQAKFKSDPQRMQKEIMKLYKAEKVNPMGGCIPMLAPMLLLYPLFIVFRSTIEFRNAPFVLWITDLSKPDIIFHLPFSLPLYGSHVTLLPIIMGITTFFQSKMTMTDPSQKMMLYFMPVFMTIIFNQFPSGLTFYYTLFNVLTLLQQKITPPPSRTEVKTT
ncbi:membrane protein insertase YidC [bacterium]|nr:membrane protein insertase YidC [bacterium]